MAKNNLHSGVLCHLKNLFFNIHQNFLVIIKLILARVPDEFGQNIWVNKLNTVVKNKLINTGNNDEIFMLKQSLKLLINMIKNIANANFKHKSEFQILKAFNDLITNCDKFTYQTAKTILFNLVRYEVLLTTFVEKLCPVILLQSNSE